MKDFQEAQQYLDSLSEPVKDDNKEEEKPSAYETHL